jgi:oligopeptide transport system permease protein
MSDPVSGAHAQPSLLRSLLSSREGFAGLLVLTLLLVACFATLPWTLNAASSGPDAGLPRYNAGDLSLARAAPSWTPPPDRPFWFSWWGTDELGRSVLVRCLCGGAISLCVGALATIVSVSIGTAYGAVAGYRGGRLDAIMMRAVDVLYSLPYVLLVVLLAVAAGSLRDEFVSRHAQRQHIITDLATQAGSPRSTADVERWLREHPDQALQFAQAAMQQAPPRNLSAASQQFIDLATLLIAIGSVSWLTTARVVRGQVMSLKTQPFIEAAVAGGASQPRILWRHILPNITGTIVVYTTLTIPQTIMQESFLSFLGIGVAPPLPSWGSLAARGVEEINPYRSSWWLLIFPCGLLATTLLALNFIGEHVRTRIMGN